MGGSSEAGGHWMGNVYVGPFWMAEEYTGGRIATADQRMLAIFTSRDEAESAVRNLPRRRVGRPVIFETDKKQMLDLLIDAQLDAPPGKVKIDAYCVDGRGEYPVSDLIAWLEAQLKK
jgi:hypothetical protein